MIRVSGRTLLDRTLDAVSGAAPVVVVGPWRPTDHEVVWTRETPSGGGPLAGLDAGLRAVPDSVEYVAVLATDHPDVTEATVDRLTEALRARPAAHGCVLGDPEGVPQWLVGVWRAPALRRAMPADAQGRSLRSLLKPLDPLSVPAVGSEACDIDTPEDLRRGGDGEKKSGEEP